MFCFKVKSFRTKHALQKGRARDGVPLLEELQEPFALANQKYSPGSAFRPQGALHPRTNPNRLSPGVPSRPARVEVGSTWGPEQPATQPLPELSQAIANCSSSPFLQVHSIYAADILLQYWMSFLDLMRLSCELD